MNIELYIRTRLRFSTRQSNDFNEALKVERKVDIKYRQASFTNRLTMSKQFNDSFSKARAFDLLTVQTILPTIGRFMKLMTPVVLSLLK